KPNICLVVRHELWPAFLVTAATSSSLVLIDGTESPTLRTRKTAKWIKSTLLKLFDMVYVADETDRAFFTDSLMLPREVVYVSGDTKYDRVRERAEGMKDESLKLKENLDSLFGDYPRIIAGSAWQKDVKAVVSAYKKISVEHGQFKGQLIIAPHDISAPMIDFVEDECWDLELNAYRYSEIKEPIDSIKTFPCVIIVDKMGILAELYGSCFMAHVGGAMHDKVHNVLEPAVRGLYLSFGPLYKNSKEAVLLTEHGLARVVKNEDDLIAFWRDCLPKSGEAYKDLINKVDELCGATDKIYRELIEKNIGFSP
ncbi:MAG: hypothetical protein HQK54_16345, partial [Oligoflexales bacterium]|nr:hypothetical protein [Oligoflexales bacterium]